MVETENCFPVLARVGTSATDLGPAVPANKFKRKFFLLVLNEHSGTTNFLDLTYVSCGATKTMRIHIAGNYTLETRAEQLASIEADPGTTVRAVANAASIEVLAVVADL